MDIRLPRLGEGADSGTVASIFVKEGEQIKKDQPILELESEKAVASIPAPEAGTVTRLHIKEGDTIKVGQLIISISEQADAAPPQRASDVPAEKMEAPVAPPPAGAPTDTAAPVPAPVAPDVPEPPDGPQPAASPTIRKMARDLGIDLRRVKGSERGGRVVMEDLRRYVARLQESASGPRTGAAGAASGIPAPPVDFSRWGSVEVQKMTTMRRTISAHMVQSWTRIPHVTQFDAADVTRILALRKTYAPRYAQQGAKLTLTSFALRAVSTTLRHHPLLNASLNEGAGELILKGYVHIGLAVDTEHGLIVPVIRDADKKTLLQLSVEVQQLADRARQRKLTIEEMQGGTFSISNQGGIGGGAFTPIINAPEVAILGLGKSAPQPVVRDGAVVERTMLPLGLSYDHRVVDGANAARFMVDVVRALEEFTEDDVKI